MSSKTDRVESELTVLSFPSERDSASSSRQLNLSWDIRDARTRSRAFRENPARTHHRGTDQQYAGQCRMSVNKRASHLRAPTRLLIFEEYRTPSTVIVSLAHVRLEPSPHLAFGLAGTSLPDRFYTFVSPTLANVRARSCSLPRSLAPRHVDSAHEQFHHGRENRSFFLPLRTYVVYARTHAAPEFRRSRLFLARGYTRVLRDARTKEESREGDLSAP